jgi:hypothetical protein
MRLLLPLMPLLCKRVGVADVHLRSVFDQATRCKPNILLHYPGDLRPLRFSNFANEKGARFAQRLMDSMSIQGALIRIPWRDYKPSITIFAVPCFVGHWKEFRPVATATICAPWAA